MSKKKKSFDELIEDALLSEEEQPYVIPNNWVWSKAGYIGKNIRGVSYKKQDIEPSKNVNNALIIRGGNIQDGSIVNQNDNVYLPKDLVKGEQKLQKGDVVIVSSTGSSKVIGKAASVSEEFVGESFGAFLTTIRPYEQINIDYFGQFYQTNNYRMLISSLAKGSNINNIKKEHFDNIPFPLPPLNEQKRIAEKVDCLLGKIEEAKQLIGEAKETFDLRKSSIIKMILNEGTNEENLPKGWYKVKVKDLFSIFGGGTPSKSKPQYWNGDIPWISAKDMKTPHIDKTIDYITEEGLNNSSAKLAKKGSVVMVVRSGILQRTLPVAYLLTECTVNQDLKVFDSGNDLINKFFLWYIRGNEKKILFNYSKSGTTVNSIEFEKFKSHEIIIPPIDVLEKKIKKIEHAIEREESVNQILNLNGLMGNLTSAILSKAFRGELGTNDPAELSAMELLKEVIILEK